MLEPHYQVLGQCSAPYSHNVADRNDFALALLERHDALSSVILLRDRNELEVTLSRVRGKRPEQDNETLA